ncbi:uncharacterized protein LOC121191116 [Toxotes jaculatrix]|uniref:uncharacterized protein LOC121191116 n=1 Tax=Toxotes jaculatrix TaxID=941984 RepID=UPI001B3AC411|nr:uncharacterized protein LOC121191116 [Toxotes jaculatrix]
MYPTSKEMDGLHSGTGVFYQAMPAVGADGKNIMKLIPVQMVNGQFIQNQISKPRKDYTPQKAVPINFSSAPVPVVKKAALNNPSVTQQVVRKQFSFVNAFSNQLGLDIENSLNKHPPQQYTENVMAKVAPITTPATNSGKSARLPCQLPVTVKSPALPRGQYLQIPPDAQVRTVPASELAPGIKKQIFTSSANSSPGSCLPNVVYVSPVMTVDQGVTPPCDPALHSLKQLSKTSSKTSCGPPAERSKPLLKLIPKVSQRPNSPIKWVIEEEDSSAAPNLNPPDSPAVTSEILRAVADRENTSKHCDAIKTKLSLSSQSKSGEAQENALVMCNGKVFFVAKKCSLPFKMGKSDSPTAATKSYIFNKTTGPSSHQPLKSVAAQTQEDIRIIIPDESDEVIDLCDDDALDDSSQPAASVHTSAVSHQDDDNVIFVSYIPPKPEAGSTHDLRLQTQTEQETEQTGTSSSSSMTEKESPNGRTGGGVDEGSALGGTRPVHSSLDSTVKNVAHVCGSAVRNTHHDNEGSNMESQQSASTQQAEGMEADVETESPAGPSSSERSRGTCSLRQKDTHNMENIPNPAACSTSSLAPQPCHATDHLLRQIFGITADVKISLQRIDEASAESVPAEPLKSESIRPAEDQQEAASGLKEKELVLQDPPRSCDKQKTGSINDKRVELLNEKETSADPATPTPHTHITPLKYALCTLKTRLSALQNSCRSGPSSVDGASCDDENAPVTGYVEPIDEDFPCTDAKDIPVSLGAAAHPQTQTCLGLNANTRRVGRTRKRTMCPCCSPGTLEPAVKSSTRLEELEKWAWMTEQMSKKGGRTKAPRKDGKISFCTQTDQLFICTQGNTRSMDSTDRLEIYIPVEAEVKNIPLWSLPGSVLRRMGLPLSDSEGSGNLAGSPEGIWICPVVTRRKGQKQASHTGNGAIENMSSLLGRKFQASPGPLRMSFVSSNHAAYKVLKDVAPGKTVSTQRSHTSLLPQGSASKTHQDAVVIYRGSIYLSIRKSSRRQSQQETRDPQPAARSSISSASSSKSLKKEMQKDNRPKKKDTTCNVTHSENKNDVTHKVRDVSSSGTARSVPQSTGSVDKVDSHCPRDPRGEQASEDAAALQPTWSQPEGEQEALTNNNHSSGGESEMQDLDGEDAESSSQNHDMDTNMQIDGGEVNQSCTRGEALGAAYGSTSLGNEFDFKQLEQEEKISQMKARLRRSEAAVSGFPSL